MKNKQKGIVTTGFTPSNNELRLKIVKECGLSTYGVYIQILSHRNTSTNECFPKNDIIAEECSCSVANVKKHINKLYDYGYLVISSGYTGKASNYYFPLEIDLNTNKSIYADAELDRILNIKRRTKDNIAEEVPAQDNNVVGLVGKEENTPITDETFMPVGKYVDEMIDNVVEGDLFEDDLPAKDNITKLINNNSDYDYVNDFYSNMNSYFNVDDKSLKTNKTIIKKVNELVDLMEKELSDNDITNVKADKIINDIMKNNQKSFNNGLSYKGINDDFRKCTYIISCINNNFINKKLPALIKSSKDNNFPPIDNGLVDYMNDNFIELSNGDRESRKEIIRRIKLSISKKDEEAVFKIIFDTIGKNNKINDCSIDTIQKIIDKLNKFYGYEFLISSRFEGLEIEDTPNIAI